MMKAVNIYSFAIETREYIGLYIQHWFYGFNMPCAIFVCVIEMWLGLLAMKQRHIILALCGIFAMMLFFVYLTAINAFFPTILGSVESCGCFGELIHFTPVASFIKSIVILCMVIIALILLIKGTTKNQLMQNLSESMKNRYMYITLALSFVPSLYSYWFMNKMDNTVYVIIYVILCSAIIITCLMKPCE